MCPFGLSTYQHHCDSGKGGKSLTSVKADKAGWGKIGAP